MNNYYIKFIQKLSARRVYSVTFSESVASCVQHTTVLPPTGVTLPFDKIMGLPRQVTWRILRRIDQRSVSLPWVKRLTWRDVEQLHRTYGFFSFLASRYWLYIIRTVGNPISSKNGTQQRRFPYFVRNDKLVISSYSCTHSPLYLINLNQLTDIHEAWHEHHATRGHTNFAFFNFPPSRVW